MASGARLGNHELWPLPDVLLTCGGAEVLHLQQHVPQLLAQLHQQLC